MRHIFKAIKPQHFPKVGDLIRSDATGDFINIVLEVMPAPAGKYWDYCIIPADHYFIRSVRYGKTNRGNFRLLNGKRSRLFVYPSLNRTIWEVVDEYVEVDNKELRRQIVSALKDIDTGYKEPAEHHHEE